MIDGSPLFNSVVPREASGFILKILGCFLVGTGGGRLLSPHEQLSVQSAFTWKPRVSTTHIVSGVMHQVLGLRSGDILIMSGSCII